MTLETKPKALAGLETMREGLRKSNPDFAEAEAGVRDAVNFCMSVRRELRQRRKTIKLDQSKLGEMLGLSQSAVSKIENGRGDMGLETLYEYADAVGLRPAVVFVPTAHAMADRESESSKSHPGEQTPKEDYVLPPKAVEAAQIAMIQTLTKSIPEIFGKFLSQENRAASRTRE